MKILAQMPATSKVETSGKCPATQSKDKREEAMISDILRKKRAFLLIKETNRLAPKIK